MERLLAPVRSEYDYILIDCPPSLNIFVINALMASDCVIVPVESQALALQGLEDTIGLIKQVQAFKSKLHILGLLLTKYDARTTLSRKVEEILRDSYGEFVFDTNIRYNITAAESPLYGRHLLEYAPNSKSAVDYCALCSEVIKRKAMTKVELVREISVRSVTEKQHVTSVKTPRFVSHLVRFPNSKPVIRSRQ